ncbi:MAG: hypothetical protein GY936_16175 [Ignavibacteriae bacterium]|nr:hypothetical protein [Ignavibacteriota bacterium]
MMPKNKKYLNQILFKELNKWYVSFYLNPFVIKSEYELVYLSELLTPSSIKIKKNDYDGKTRIVSKVKFSNGKIYLRNENKTGMDLYLLQKDDLLVSKINFHQGALAINNFENLVCSTHYQPYKINTQKVNGNFLVSILRSKSFLNFVQYLRADGIKNEATFEFIGNLKIPLPSIEKQKILLKRFNDKMKLADEWDKRGNQIRVEIENYLKDVLDIQIEKGSISSKGLEFVNLNLLDRWAVDFLIRLSSLDGLRKGKYPIQKLRDFLISYQYGISEKATKNPIGIPMLRMNNIFDSELVVDNLKYIQLEKGKKKKLLLNKGDLLLTERIAKNL